MISISKTQTRWFVGLVIIAHFFIIFVLGLFRYWGYMSSINDIGQYDQAIWGILHGEPFLNTISFNKQVNWLGHHFNPILILFTPLYAIIPSVHWLTFAQALALSLAAWPLFLLASHVCLSEKTGLLWAVTYLANPFLLNAAAWDFHPITLAVPFVATSMLAIEKKNPYLLFAVTLVILLCKEHYGIMAVGFGLLWYIRNKSWQPGAGLILIGLLHSFIVLGIVMPALSPTGEHIMLASRYGWLGHSVGEIIIRSFTDPFSIIKVVMIDFGGIYYIALLLSTFCGFPILAPEFLLPGSADLLANLLSANSMSKANFAYHSVALIPVLAAAAVYGVKRLSSHQVRFTLTQLTGLAVIAGVAGGYMLAPLPLSWAQNFWAPVHFPSLPDHRVQIIRSLLGDSASVTAQANIGSHFSQRKQIYRYPNKVGKVDVIVLRLESPTTNINNFSKELKNRIDDPKMLDSHLQMDRTEYIFSIEHLLSSKEYGVLFWNDPWLVMKRGGLNKNSETVKKITQKINLLKKDWNTAGFN